MSRVWAMGRMGWTGDMLDCLVNIENAELKRKIVWPIAPREEPKSGGYYRKMRERAPAGGGLLGR